MQRLEHILQKKITDSIKKLALEDGAFVKTTLTEKQRLELNAYISAQQKRAQGNVFLSNNQSYNSDLDDYMKRERMNRTFAQYLQQKCSELNVTIVEVYKASQLHRKFKVNILDSQPDNPYQPDKDTAIKVGMSLHLDHTDMEELLSSAGYSLSYHPADLVIRYCIEKEIYKPHEIEALYYEATKKRLYA